MADPKRPDYEWWNDDPSDPCKSSFSMVVNTLYNMPKDDVDILPWSRKGVMPEKDDELDWRGVRRRDVNEWPMPKEPVLPRGEKPYSKYYFFDTPDYADPFAKLWWTTKCSLSSGIFISALGISMGIAPELKDSSGYLPTLKVMAKHTYQVMAVSLVTTAAVISIANMRGKKDDYWNWVGAGAFTALCLGNNHGWPVWWKASIYGIPALVVWKNGNEGNYSLFNFLTKRKYSHKHNAGMHGGSGDRGFASGDLRFGARGMGVDRARKPM